LLYSRRDLKATAMFLFCEAKAKTARRACENFPSGKLFVGKSLPTRKITYSMPLSDSNIIYEDEDILAINKPAGLLVHPVKSPESEGENLEQATLVSWLVEKYPEIKNVGDLPTEQSGRQAIFLRPGIVHRLDKDTSGVLLVAKNQKAFEYLKNQFKDREIKKKYIALASGNLKQDSGIIELPIGKSKKDFRKRSTFGQLAGKIREAVTEYKVLERFDNYTLTEITPKTGRTHQIRTHLKGIGHPIACDKLYGPKKLDCPFGLKRHFLHAISLEFALMDGSKIKLESDLPEDLETVLSGLRKEK